MYESSFTVYMKYYIIDIDGIILFELLYKDKFI